MPRSCASRACGNDADLVTHDVEEAIVLADHVVVLHPRPGRVGEARAIDLPYPRDPLAPDVAEAVRGLRLALAGLSTAPC